MHHRMLRAHLQPLIARRPPRPCRRPCCSPPTCLTAWHLAPFPATSCNTSTLSGRALLLSSTHHRCATNGAKCRPTSCHVAAGDWPRPTAAWIQKPRPSVSFSAVSGSWARMSPSQTRLSSDTTDSLPGHWLVTSSWRSPISMAGPFPWPSRWCGAIHSLPGRGLTCPCSRNPNAPQPSHGSQPHDSLLECARAQLPCQTHCCTLCGLLYRSLYRVLIENKD